MMSFYFFQRIERILNGLGSLLQQEGVLRLFIIGLVFYFTLIVFGSFRNRPLNRSVLIGALGSLSLWPWIVERTLQSFDMAEGWQRSLSISFGLLYGIEIGVIVFISIFLMSYYFLKTTDHSHLTQRNLLIFALGAPSLLFVHALIKGSS